MIDLDSTFFVQLVNFLIILTVLNLLLFRPIRGILKKRAEVMAERLRAVEDFTAQAEAKMAGYRQALADARSEAQAVRAALKEEGIAVEANTLAAASEKAAAKLAAARQEIEAQKNAALAALQGQVAAFAKQVAAKVLARG
ncbi:hypothetical protein TDMWS_00600 [Thermodesulfomicrobium sp. WS]|uniref:ATP synthase F0 subunit B n=1 Tax=Thermodesulfomicrobium sp. WS TaxID=3004129 RepID=UPI0024931E39|nr:ATP synthase F0 subunit B [Thermodesulfomicrobium sp. WS]BDU99974.1 hypothetical protein TDMWS_00600 [Thermodesulfomicrobium sp. WS]